MTTYLTTALCLPDLYLQIKAKTIAWLLMLPEAARSIKQEWNIGLRYKTQASCIKKAEFLSQIKFMIHSMNANIQKNVAFLLVLMGIAQHQIET